MQKPPFWERFDIAALRALHGFTPPRWLHWPLIVFVRIFDGWAWAGIAAWLWFAMPWASFRRTLAECLLAIAISLLLYWPIKLIIRRSRPYEAHGWVTRKVPPLDRYSFPSGHTMNNLAVSLTLASQMPWLYGPAVSIPLLLGILRVVYGVHFLTDILAGATLGLASHLTAKSTLGVLAAWIGLAL